MEASSDGLFAELIDHAISVLGDIVQSGLGITILFLFLLALVLWPKLEEWGERLFRGREPYTGRIRLGGGAEFHTGGELRRVQVGTELFVIGRGYVCPCRSEDEVENTLEGLRARLEREE